ncbi:MAG: hypothetical protein IKO11_07885 [Lachnospiraceae bacterium]|nr:hypothetical protein [Lachnospiraceae bacterium]
MIALVKAFLACWALVLLAGWRVRDPLSIFSFAALLALFLHEAKLEKKTSKTPYLLTAGLFSLATLLVKYASAVSAFESSLFRLACILILAAGSFLFYSALLHSAYDALAGTDLPKFLCREAGKSFPERHILLFSFLLLSVWYLLWFLYSYPGIFDPDPINQIEQFLGMDTPSDHHPYVHTLLISLFYHIGRLFSSNINFCIGLYTFFQMCFFAFSAAAVVYTLHRYLKLRFGLCMAVLAFYALPFMAVQSILVCKDTPFASALMLFVCILTAMVTEQKLSLPAAAGFVLSGIGVCTLRTNGFYAFLLFAPFFLFFFRNKWKKALPLPVLTVLVVLLIKGPVFNAIGVQKGDLVESLHVPMQQVACVVARGRAVDEGDKALIGELCDYDQIPGRYVPWLADSIKELIRGCSPQVLEERKGDFFRLWLKLGLRYPKDYIDAWTGLTETLIWPDGGYDVAVIEGVFPNGLGLESRPLIGGKLLAKVRELLLKLGSFVPLYGFFFSMGSYACILLFFAGYLLQSKMQRRRLLILMPAFCLIFTLFLAIPVGKYFRYAWSYAILLPFVFCTLIPGKELEKEENS